MIKAEELSQVVQVFAQYGFRKTSMSDIANGIGISRQALYNRFSSKEEIFDEAAKALVEKSCRACLNELGQEAPLPDRLAAAIHAWVGQYVDLLKASPHSTEILAMVGDVSGAETRLATQRIKEAMAKAISDSNAKMPKERADDLAFVLYISAKGLLTTVESSENHRVEMQRIIRAVLLS